MSARTVRERTVYETEIEELMHRCRDAACSASLVSFLSIEKTLGPPNNKPIIDISISPSAIRLILL
jgi:hypothetical protein